MGVSITPDYDLFIQIIFILWIAKGVFQFLCGLLQVEVYMPEKYGTLHVLDGIIILLLVLWCCW